MSLEEISREHLEELALYLDKHSDGHSGGEEEEFWRLLIKELKKVTPASGVKKIRYKMVEVEDFATELLTNGSPSLKLLYDLQAKKLKLDVFISCLEKIGCVGAQNVFRTAAPPVITEHPESQNLRTGQDIVLSCKAECTPPAEYLWFLSQKPIRNSNSNTLIIRNANSGHSGMYVCRASNPNINDPMKSVFSEWAEVEVIEPTPIIAQSPIRQATDDCPPALSPPTITLQPTPTTVDLGESAQLECRGRGQGLVYDWYKDGRQFRPDQRHGKLIFDPMRIEDVGEYYCEVVNDVGKIKSDPAKLAVCPLITITKHPKDCRGQVGAKLSLHCVAKGPPGQLLVYQWFKKEPGSNKDTEIAGTEEVCHVHLSYTPLLEYKLYCRVSLAENIAVAMQSEVAVITVQTIWITQQPQSIDCYIGDRASLTCRAVSYHKDQKINYIWFQSDTPGGKKKPVHVVPEGSRVLSFDRLGQKNWGYYVCQAQTDYQYVQSEEVYVKVAAPPPKGSREKDLARPTIRFTKHPWSQVTPLGGKFRLLCEAHSTGDEPLHYQWYFNGSPLDGETGDKLRRERVLQGNFGSYYCEVQTHEGLARHVTSTARIEQACSVPPEESDRVMSGLQLDQQEAERLLITAKEERYARGKVALLIGNQKYECKDMVKLNSPENDTRELAEKLRELNFKVFSFVNLNFREMMDALEVFYGMLTLSGIYALFYYTGHGFSHGGVTYLMPVDATLPPRCDHNIAADDIGAHMQNRKSRAVKILDCCRTSDSDNIVSPTMSRTASLGYSNIVEISSCSAWEQGLAEHFTLFRTSTVTYPTHQPSHFPPPAPGDLWHEITPTLRHSDHAAYESRDHEEPNTTFNAALRDALQSRRKITEVFDIILDNMRNAPQSKNGKPYQRPTWSSSLADPHITLHDDVMLDDPAAEEKLYEIGCKWEKAHALPDPVLLPDELGGLLSVKLNFSHDFSNVLVVGIILIPAGNCTSATVDIDTMFLERQGLRGELYRQEGAPPDHPTHTIATLKVANLQRLKGNLKLCLNVSVTEPGRGVKKGNVVHELQQRPLFANNVK